MNILRASVSEKGGRWQVRLLDLLIRADGDNEEAMLRDLEEAITSEYHLALHLKQTPFVNLLLAVPVEVSRSWEDGGKSLRSLALPPEVSQALAAVFRRPQSADFRLCDSSAA